MTLEGILREIPQQRFGGDDSAVMRIEKMEHLIRLAYEAGKREEAARWQGFLNRIADFVEAGP